MLEGDYLAVPCQENSELFSVFRQAASPDRILIVKSGIISGHSNELIKGSIHNKTVSSCWFIGSCPVDVLGKTRLYQQCTHVKNFHTN